MKVALLAVFLALPLAAQAPKTPKPEASQTEQLAIQALRLQINQVEGNIDKFEAEYTKAHPGWNLNVRTGEPMPIEPPKAEVKPAVKK